MLLNREYKIKAFEDNNKIFTLDDGSKWKMWGNGLVEINLWRTGDTVAIKAEIPHHIFVNTTRGGSIDADKA